MSYLGTMFIAYLISDYYHQDNRLWKRLQCPVSQEARESSVTETEYGRMSVRKQGSLPLLRLSTAEYYTETLVDTSYPRRQI